MSRLPQTLALLFILLTFAAVAHAKDDGHDKDRAFIKKAYADMDKAYKDRNADDHTKYMDNSVVLTTNGGQKILIKRGKVHRLFAQQVGGHERLDAHTIIYNIDFYNQSASVQCKTLFDHYNNLNGKIEHSVDYGTYRNTWRKVGKGWRIHSLYSPAFHTLPILNSPSAYEIPVVLRKPV